MRRHPDSNRGIEVLQTSALPLGYAAGFATLWDVCYYEQCAIVKQYSLFNLSGERCRVNCGSELHGIPYDGEQGVPALCAMRSSLWCLVRSTVGR